MCFYVYAPSNTVLLKYVSETITLNKLSSEIVVDILLENTSGKEVNTLNVLYPNSFWVEFDSELSFRGQFDDITEDLIDPASKHNLLYESMHFHLQSRPVNQGVEVTLTGPDPGDIDADKSYVGLICGRSKLEPLAGLSDEQKQVLHECRTTVFECELSRPILPDESRWFRWRIRPPITALNRDSRGKRFMAHRVLVWVRTRPKVRLWPAIAGME